MMFKKGSFEVGGVIYPVAIKVRVTIRNKLLLILEIGTSLGNRSLINDQRFGMTANRIISINPC